MCHINDLNICHGNCSQGQHASQIVLRTNVDLFKKGLKYTTIGQQKSTMLVFHNLIVARNLGDQARVSDLVTGIFTGISLHSERVGLFLANY